jgi:hypothetical protein
MTKRAHFVLAMTATLFAAAAGCAGGVTIPPTAPNVSGGFTFISPRCPAVRSCLMGQVIAADTAAPLSRAAVFLERENEGAPAPQAKPLRIVTLTDEQGVFTVVDAPIGRYRLAVYKDARRLEAHGLRLGDPGTTMVPVRLPAT